MRYIGSKAETVDWLGGLVSQHMPKASSLCDPFAGACSVSFYFKRRGFRIRTGDALRLSYAAQVAKILLNRAPQFRGASDLVPTQPGQLRYHSILHWLNGSRRTRGYFFQNFSEAGGRAFFSDQNAMKIDGVRSRIKQLAKNHLVTPSEHALLLYNLLEATDRVANTAGTFYAHLRSFTRRANDDLRLTPVTFHDNQAENECMQSDARATAECDHDILYLDPPYNRRDYASYYHLTETIAVGDDPVPSGASGVPSIRRYPPSDFAMTHAATALTDLLRRSNSRHIIVQYADDGLIGHEQMMDTLAAIAPVSFAELPVRKYATNKTRTGRVIHRVYWCSRR